MKSRLDEIWKAIAMIAEGRKALDKAVSDYENELTQQNAAAETLDGKIDKLQRTESDLSSKGKELIDTNAKLDAAKAALAKIKESI